MLLTVHQAIEPCLFIVQGSTSPKSRPKVAVTGARWGTLPVALEHKKRPNAKAIEVHCLLEGSPHHYLCVFKGGYDSNGKINTSIMPIF